MVCITCQIEINLKNATIALGASQFFLKFINKKNNFQTISWNFFIFNFNIFFLRTKYSMVSEAFIFF